MSSPVDGASTRTRPTLRTLPARDRYHEFLGGMRVREARDLHVHQAGGLARLHHVALGNLRASLRTDHPDGAVPLEELLHGDEPLEIAALVRGHEDRIDRLGAARGDGRAARLDLLAQRLVAYADEQ